MMRHTFWSYYATEKSGTVLKVIWLYYHDQVNYARLAQKQNANYDKSTFFGVWLESTTFESVHMLRQESFKRMYTRFQLLVQLKEQQTQNNLKTG